MFKQLPHNNIDIEKIELNPSQTLTQNSTGIDFFKGIQSSSNTSFKQYWNSVNTLFYIAGGYTESTYQSKTLSSECKIGSIASKYYGQEINPKSFQLINTSGSNVLTIKDDGHGNLYNNAIGTGSIKGNIFYRQGIYILTDTTARYQYIGSGSNALTFKGKHYIYEHSYLCEIEAGEMNATLNPSFVSGSNNTILHTNMPTYITTIGLYDDKNRLVAVGKLARPIYNDPEQSLSIEVQFDM